MILGIAPLVRGGDRRTALLVTSSHLIGGGTGGAAAAGALWILFVPIRQLPISLRLSLLAILVGLAWFDQARSKWRVLPSRNVQVPQDWTASMSPFRAYFLYGVLLGAHLFTYIPHAAVFVSLIGGGLILDLWYAALGGVALGVGRTAALAYALWAPPEPIRFAGTLGTLSQWTKVGGEVLLGAMGFWVAMSWVSTL